MLRCLGATVAAEASPSTSCRLAGLCLFGAGSVRRSRGGAAGAAGVVSELPAVRDGRFCVLGRGGRAWRQGWSSACCSTLLPLLSIPPVSPLLALRSGFGEEPPRAIRCAGRCMPLSRGRTRLRAVADGPLAARRGLRAGAGGGLRRAHGHGAACRVGRAPVVSAAAALCLAQGWRTCTAQQPHRAAARLARPRHIFGAHPLPRARIASAGVSRSTARDRPNLAVLRHPGRPARRPRGAVRSAGAPERQEAPIVTMRVSALKGRPVDECCATAPCGIPAWTLRHEYRSTYRGAAHRYGSGSLRLVHGTGGAGHEVVPVSLEEGLAKEMQVQVGDEINFECRACRSGRAWRACAPWSGSGCSRIFSWCFPRACLSRAKFHVLAVRARRPPIRRRCSRPSCAPIPTCRPSTSASCLQTFDGIFAKGVARGAVHGDVRGGHGDHRAGGRGCSPGRFQRVRENVCCARLGADAAAGATDHAGGVRRARRAGGGHGQCAGRRGELAADALRLRDAFHGAAIAAVGRGGGL